MEKLHALQATLAVGWHYFCVHLAGPLAATIIPTILAGLMRRPGADASKLVKLLKLAIRACGWAVHYDEPGSVKPPLWELVQLLWKGGVMVYRVFKPAPAALLLLIPLLTGGCDWHPIDATTGLDLALAVGICALTWHVRSRWVLLGVVVASTALQGCVLSTTPKNATLAQKLQTDVAALEKIASDVSLNCGAELAYFAKTVTTAIAAAASYEDLLADVMNAAALYNDGKMDVAAVKCVIATVRADVKALTPQKKAMLERLMADLEAGQSLPYSVATR